MRRIAAEKRAAEAAAAEARATAAKAAAAVARNAAARHPLPKAVTPQSAPARKAPKALSSWDRLGREVDLARRRDLVDQAATVMTDQAGAMAPGHLKTLVELMRQQTATTTESRSILLTLGRTAQVAPERLADFGKLGGLAVLGSWLKAAAPHAQSQQQKSIAVGCIRVMAKLPVSQELLQKSRVALAVKEVAQRCPWAQKDVQALLKHWCTGVLQEQASPAVKAPGLVLASQVTLPKPAPPQPAQKTAPPSSSSSSSSDDEAASSARDGRGTSSGAASAGKDQVPTQSRFEPRKPTPEEKAKRRRVDGDAQRAPEEAPEAVSAEDAEVQALLKELASLDELLLPPD